MKSDSYPDPSYAWSAPRLAKMLDEVKEALGAPIDATHAEVLERINLLREPLSRLTTDTELKTDAEVGSLCRRLASLLDDHEAHGMASWATARYQVGRQLHEALGNALGSRADLS